MAENKFASSKEKPKSGKTSYIVFDVDDLAVRIYGETAVVTGRSTPKGRNAKGEPVRGQIPLSARSGCSDRESGRLSPLRGRVSPSREDRD